MPSLRAHCAMSRKRTGHGFEELHRWIDEYQEDLGSEHRSHRHFWSKEVKKVIKEKWEKKERGLGDVAVEEWLFHIIIDNISTLFKIHQKNHPRTEKNFLIFGLRGNGYIYYKDGFVSEGNMEKYFEKPE